MASWKNTSGKADSEVREADAVFLWVTFHCYSDERCSTALLWLHVACSQFVLCILASQIMVNWRFSP